MRKTIISKRKFTNSTGIGVVELLLTIALTGILSIATLPLGIKFIQKNQLKNTRDTLISYLNTSKSFAMNGKNDNDWGVNVTGTKITLFNGPNFVGRNTPLDQEYEITGDIIITPTEIVFTKESGDTAGGTVDIYCVGGVSYKITVDTQGNVTFN